MDNYEKFREILDCHPSGAPQSDAFRKILELLFTPEEMAIAIYLSFKQKTAEEISANTSISLDDAKKHLEAMAEKVVINSRKKNGEIFYSLLPTVPGLFEMSFMKGGSSPMVEALGKLWVEYNHEAMIESLCGDPTPQMRVVPVQESLESQSVIHSYAEIEKFIGESTYLAVGHCACKVSSNNCEAPREVCLIFGSLGKAIVERGHGREITIEEGIEILKEAEKSGLVHMSNNSADKPSIVCNCCPCCCHFLKGLFVLKNSNAIAPSPYIVQTDLGVCTGCGICGDERCPAGAIEIKHDKAVITEEKCIGCGLCVTGCPSDALVLEIRKDVPDVPKTMQEMMMKMLMEKGKLEKFTKLIQ